MDQKHDNAKTHDANNDSKNTKAVEIFGIKKFRYINGIFKLQIISK